MNANRKTSRGTWAVLACIGAAIAAYAIELMSTLGWIGVGVVLAIALSAYVLVRRAERREHVRRMWREADRRVR